MVREAVDVGIRIGPIPDASGTSRLITKMKRAVVAAPSYLERAGTPELPADLSAHRIVGGPVTANPCAWTFERDGRSATLDLPPHVTIHDTAGCVAAAKAGLGITSTTEWACAEEVASGSLVRLLAAWQMPELTVQAYFPSGRSTRKTARAFVDFVAAEIHARRT